MAWSTRSWALSRHSRPSPSAGQARSRRGYDQAQGRAAARWLPEPSPVIIAMRGPPDIPSRGDSPTVPSSILFRPGDNADLEALEIDRRRSPSTSISTRSPRPSHPSRCRTRSGRASSRALRDPDAVAFRHEVFRDLESPRAARRARRLRRADAGRRRAPGARGDDRATRSNDIAGSSRRRTSTGRPSPPSRTR